MEATPKVVEEFARHRLMQSGADTDPVLVVVRDHRVIASLESTDFGELMDVAQIAAVGYGADALGMVFEGVAPLVETNPLTGRPWRPGEADDTRRERDGVARGWVREVAITIASVRGGATQCILYTLTRTGDIVELTSREDPTNGVGPERILQEALAKPAADPAKVPDPDGDMRARSGSPLLPVEAGRVSLDIGCTRVLDGRLRRGSAVFVPRDTIEADQLRSEGLMAWQVRMPPG